jgi:hypothetical protein
MGIFTTKAQAKIQEMRVQAATADANRATAIANEERGRVTELKGKVQEYQKVQELLVKDILTLQEVEHSYVGNEYRDYASGVLAISEKYGGTSEWGCLQTGAVVDLRAAFILGEGLKIVAKTGTKEEAQAEIDWAEGFLAYNALDAEMAQELVKESEIEGKIALRLFWDEATDEAPIRYGDTDYPGMVSVRFISWLSKKYIVDVDLNDYLWYKRLTWPATTAVVNNVSILIPAGEVLEPEFVYTKFGGRIYDANDAQPKIMKCLTQIDRLDKALRDLREINHLFASPTPSFQCATPQQASALLQQIKDINWKIGKAIASTAVFTLVSPDSSGVENLVSEIELNVKMISGTTGIPIHYLGLLDLLKNRATGDNTRELVMAATTREREIWIGAFEELLEKAMLMYNERSGGAQKSTEGGRLDPSKVGIEIPLVTQDQWANIQNVLIPAALGGIISNEHVASQIPGVDQEKETELREEREAKEAEQAERDMEKFKTEVDIKAKAKGAVE